MKWSLAISLLITMSGCGGQQPADGDAVPDIKPMESTLQTECREYLEQGPPEHMENYVPESLTEILIAHGAKGDRLDPELAEIGSIILLESDSLSDIEDPQTREYMRKGAELVKRVLEANE